MDSFQSKLSPLQREFVESFFSKRNSFFLTGGGALAGYHLGHRRTEDLDLFAVPGTNLEDGVRLLRLVADELGAQVESIQESPDFRRFAVNQGAELTVIDLVVDRAPQLIPEKPLVGNVRVDPLREIAANKICALLGRNAPRDLVDLRALLSAGMSLQQILEDASHKDRAADPATLAWVLGRFPVDSATVIPEGISVEDLEVFRGELIRELGRIALPSS